MNRMTADEKAIQVCRLLRTMPAVMTPKQFLSHFLLSNNQEIAYLRRFWAQETGIASTMELVQAMRNEINSTEVGRQAWTSFILQEVSRCSPSYST